MERGRSITPAEAGPASSGLFVRAAIIAAMGILSVVMWLASPIAWLWFASALQADSNPALWPYAVVFGGMIFTAIVIGGLLGRLDHFYLDHTQTAKTSRQHDPWFRSVRGERELSQPHSVLVVVMVGSVGLALGALGLWWVLFAGSPLPA